MHSSRTEQARDLSQTPAEAILVETKLRAPPGQPELIDRARLKQRLDTAAGRRLTLIACPAGFGKTSLLADWCDNHRSGMKLAWLTIDREDNDPAVLWSYVLEAIRRVCPDIDRTAVALPPRPPIVELLLPRLVNALALEDAVTLVLDDFHLLTDGRARESIHWLVQHAPHNFHLVLSTRSEPDLPLATLRAHGDLVELRAEDLRFTAEETDRFLNGGQKLDLDAEDLDLLLERTGGWPAGLYLAALSLRHTDDRHNLVTRFGASNRHVTDFLEAEVMAAHDPADRDMMVRCSILERFSGPLCDAVLERSGSAEALRRLSQGNLFLVRYDDRGDWYRFHPLFRQLLRVELERREPSLAVKLHRGAYAWHLEQGDIGRAIDHALTAGMDIEAARLVASTWHVQINSGRYDTVLAWIDRFPPHVVDRDVQLVLARAWTQSMSGRQREAAVSVALAERLLQTHPGPLPDGFSSAESSLETLRGVFPWGNVRVAQAHALRSLELEGPDCPWHAVACWAVAMAHFWRGELTEADALFAEVVVMANLQRGHWLIACASLAYRSLIAGQAGHLERQAELAEESGLVARQHDLENSTCGPSMALGASLTARGRPAEALPILENAVALARFQGQPLVLLRTLRLLGEALSALGAHEQAAAVGAEAQAVLAACVDPASLAGSAGSRHAGSGVVAMSPNGQLTHRELTVLTLLVGDLSEADIARKLFVSHSTVHSHVKSIYLKLGATSRAEAVDTARAAGFLPAYRSRNAAPGEPRADATTRRSESDIPLRMGQFRAKRSHESASSGPVTD